MLLQSPVDCGCFPDNTPAEVLTKEKTGLCHMFKALSVLLLLFVGAVGCQNAFADNLQSRAPYAENQVSFIPGDAQKMWEDYTFNTLALDDYQPGCEPMQYRPELDVQYRGVVILLHGFTSCPKQFSAMAESFTKKGYHVLVPVLPGHGRAGANEIEEQFELPGIRNWRNYDSFAIWLNKLARSISHGEIHIGGLCLGGTIASRAMQLEPSLYTRSLLLSPFFEVSKPLLGKVGRLIGRIGDFVKIDNGLDLAISLEDIEICENVERRIYGRAGYCKVRISNLIGVARFARFVQTNWRDVQTSIQTILVHGDPVAHPLSTLKTLEHDGLSVEIKNSTCVMNSSASHSPFSPTDLPQPKPWLPELHKELTEFLADGKPLTQTFTSHYNWPISVASVGSCALFP